MDGDAIGTLCFGDALKLGYVLVGTVAKADGTRTAGDHELNLELVMVPLGLRCVTVFVNHGTLPITLCTHVRAASSATAISLVPNLVTCCRKFTFGYRGTLVFSGSVREPAEMGGSMRRLLVFPFVFAIAGCPGPGGNNLPTGDVVIPPASCSDSLKNQGETDVDCGGPNCAPCAVGSACQSVGDCASPAVCSAGVCDVGLCDNSTQDTGETEVDCGGDCRACLGGNCTTNADCVAGFCNQTVCSEPACTDAITNGSETATDCGGSCPGCADGLACVQGGDCASGVCQEGLCTTPAPSCDDGVTNGGETDIDCGGSACSGCAAGASCSVASDCVSEICTAGACAVPPTCTDGNQNGNETAVDCGGGACAPCASGLVCGVDGDCLSTFCLFGQCTAPSCSDSYANGDETDVDCGGPQCDGCAAGAACNAASDCKDGLCSDGNCQVPAATCNDGTKNGTETAVDCGGGACAACNSGLSCGVDADCKSQFCLLGQCTNPNCLDGYANGAETDVDCGGDLCPACDVGAACSAHGDCVLATCISGACTTPTCADAVANQDESDTDCGGATCDVCSPGAACGTAADCDSGVCTSAVCAPSTCSDGVLNQGESGVDCGGPCELCPMGTACTDSAGCLSGVCDGTCVVDFSFITAGGWDTFCGITTHDASVRCWPDVLSIPGTGYTSLALGVFPNAYEANRLCGLKADGSWVCDGIVDSNYLPQTGRFSKLVMGIAFVCGQHLGGPLLTAGTVSCYGPYAPELSPAESATVYHDLTTSQRSRGVFLQELSGNLKLVGNVNNLGPPNALVPYFKSSLQGGLGAVTAMYNGLGVKGWYTGINTSGTESYIEDLQGYEQPFYVGAYDVAVDSVTKLPTRFLAGGAFDVPPPEGPVTEGPWYGYERTCSRHGEGTRIVCWGTMGAYDGIQPPDL